MEAIDLESLLAEGASPEDVARALADDLLSAALADLAHNPGSTAAEIARRTQRNRHDMFQRLDQAAYKGLCQRFRLADSRQPWRWEIPARPCLEGDTP